MEPKLPLSILSPCGNHSRGILHIFASVFLCGIPGAAQAASLTWSGTDNAGGTGWSSWTTWTNNWNSGGSNYVNGSDVVFNGGGTSYDGGTTYGAAVWESLNYNVGNMSFSNKNYTIGTKPGTTAYSASLTLTSGNIDVGSGVTATFLNNAGSGQSFSLHGSNGIKKTGDGTLIINCPSDITGATSVSGGTLNLGVAAAVRGTVTINNGGTLKTTADWGTGGTYGSGNIGAITVNAGGTLTTTSVANGITNGLTLNGGTVSGSGRTNSDWGEFSIDSNVSAGLSAASTSTISAELAVSSTRTFEVGTGSTLNISGAMHDRNGGGAGGVTKTGLGTMTLSNTNIYTGATTVNGGILNVTGSTGDSAVTVNNSGTVLASGTTGTIGKGVTVNNGAILAAGGQNAIGTATVGSDGLKFNSGSIFEWDLASGVEGTRGTDYDGVTVGGTLSADSGGAAAIFKVVLGSGSYAADFWKTNHDWTGIFTASNPINMANIFSDIQWAGGSSMTTPNTQAPGHFSFTNSGNTLTWTAVPEPTTALAGLLLTFGLLRRRRQALVAGVSVTQQE